MNSQFDLAVMTALDDLVASAPDLGPTPTDAHVAPTVDGLATLAPLVVTKRARPTGRPRRIAVIASGLVAAAGLAAVVLVKTRDVADPRVPATQPSPAVTPDTIRVAAVEDENLAFLWDSVAIATRTVGWFQLGDVPSTLSTRVGAKQQGSDRYSSQFFRCVEWTEATTGITCTKLAGGNYINHTWYGTTVEVGVQLGDGLDPTLVLWQLAQGSLWGYDTVTEAPTPTPVAIGAVTGWSYRNNDDVAYLVWERSPGVIVWLKTTGFTDAEIADLAATARPVDLPERLPVLLTVGETVIDANGTGRTLTVGSLNGIRCAGIPIHTDCTRIDHGPALVRSLDGSAPIVAAIVPTGTAATFVVTLADGQQRTLALTEAGLGIRTAIYTPPAAETIVSAQINDPNGTVLQTLDLTADPDQSTATTAAAAAPTNTPSPTDLVAVPGNGRRPVERIDSAVAGFRDHR